MRSFFGGKKAPQPPQERTSSVRGNAKPVQTSTMDAIESAAAVSTEKKLIDAVLGKSTGQTVGFPLHEHGVPNLLQLLSKALEKMDQERMTSYNGQSSSDSRHLARHLVVTIQKKVVLELEVDGLQHLAVCVEQLVLLLEGFSEDVRTALRSASDTLLRSRSWRRERSISTCRRSS